MKLFQPPKLLHLILIGYCVILLPLVAAMIRGAQSLSHLSSRNSEQIEKVINLVRSSESVSQDLIDLERTLRQYEVLGKSSLREVFENRRSVLQVTISSLSRFVTHSDELSLVAGDMNRALQSIVVNPLRDQAKPDEPLLWRQSIKRALSQLELLTELHKRFKRLISDDFDRFIVQAEENASRTHSFLIIMGIALIPGTLLLVGFFTSLIARPIKQIEEAIQRLSAGDYLSQFAVHGPRDLQALGLQLQGLGENLKSADEGKKRFLRHMSHELKTPLASIKEGTALLRDEIPGALTDSQAEVVEIMHDGVENLQVLMNNLLDFNLLSQAHHSRKELCNIYDLVCDIVRYHRLTIQRKQVDLQTTGDRKLSVKVDRNLLRTALDNLISNAIHFTPSQGKVCLDWLRNEELAQLIISVKDTGPGVGPEEKELIFKPFVQGKARRYGPIKGSGLGLSVVSECARAIGAEVGIKDSGQGAHFELRIPSTLTKET